ncbi:hypothetical protein KSS93_17915 [Pseudomonas xanthosomatis]|uniref:hypothetical protein n=1 Tax=Pseudomonas xanthosomatis TaxID=2842356 RepID=UPI001C3DF0C7|nr:hypothetical protein [Pseudomonas xanthosomatis]QXH44756.1 hypothetical protein KSS93_17915 [Pseudomonas xanthosomatis]
MDYYPLSGYLAVLADSDLFGSLALFNLCVLLAGLQSRIRRSPVYPVLCVLAMSCMPMLHAADTWYLNNKAG